MGAKDRDSIALFFRALFHLVSFKCCSAIYNITSSQALSQGQTLVSSNQVFELGFFTPNNTANKYVGIWYKQVSPRRVVWVANRDSPITVADSPPSLTIGSNGNLELLDRNRNSVWSTNVKVRSNSSSMAILSDYGNLILKDDTQHLWESFKHPGDTFIPGGEMGFNVKTGENFFFTSWKSNNDPSVGKFTTEISKEKPPEAIIWMNGSKAKPHWRSGPWAKGKFVGIPEMNTLYRSSFNLVEETEQGTTSFLFNWDYNNSTLLNMLLTSEGVLKVVRKTTDQGSGWYTDWEAPKTQCDVYGVCGPFGVCNDFESPVCKCMKGFGPKSLEEWSKGNWTRGCERRSQLLCDKNTSGLAHSRRGKKDGFWKIGSVKLPHFYEYVEPVELDFADTESCQKWCLNNCSCIAYSYLDNIGCLVWSQDLIDIEWFSYGGEDLFLRLAHSELVGGDKVKKIIISLAVLSSVGTIVVIVLCLQRWKARKEGNNKKITEHTDLIQLSDSLKDVQFSKQHEPSDLPSFDFGTILHVTNNFSSTNKLGQGGFGSVYKGKLQDGKEIAVKRLSSSSGQGTEEFKNELILISKLQHRNLVRLLGCCIEKEERLLVYELMPNKSLDNYIFDPRGREQLNWDARMNIILGVARGLLYLHRDSSLRVIHRDLKASNILLDEKMNPKISDFGLARIFQETIDLANSTQRVVGTLGYMSPEYAMGGVFSEKSDVFSFGVLILEIVSGKKNSNFHYYEQNLSLVAYAWQLWSEGRGVEFVDDAMGGSYVELEAIRCIHVGLLCVQDHTTDRPSMADVVLMLGNETNRPQPIRPIFTFHNSPSSQKPTTSSVNDATVSMMEGLLWIVSLHNYHGIREGVSSDCRIWELLSEIAFGNLFFVSEMASNRDDSLQSISVRLDGNNYSYWNYVMKKNLKGKKMWGYVSGTLVKPTNDKADYATLLDNWEVDNSKIITWINNSIEHSIELGAFAPHIAHREEQRLVQFFMALRDDFEGLRGSILHRSPLPSVDSVVSELLADEIRLKSQARKGILPAPSPSVLVGVDECSFCKQKGHWKAQCPKLVNRAPSQQRHQLIPQFGNQPPHYGSQPQFGNHSQPRPYRPSQFNVAATVPPSDLYDFGASSSNPALSALSEQFKKFLTMQPHAMSASSSIGQPPTSTSGMTSSTWILDSRASHHMSPHSKSFVSLCPASSVPVMTADGTPMSLAGVGSVVSHHLSLPNVYHIPKLSLNLVSVGQLCDSAPSVDLSSFRLSPSSSSFYLWHSRLGHVSTSRLRFLASTRTLGDLQVYDISDCSGYKLAKFSALPFSKSTSCSVAPFDLVHSDVWGPSLIATKGGSRYYFSYAISNITQSDSLSQRQTLISPSQKFELGFFSPSDKSRNQYVGMWYKGISPVRVVWVANRENPLAASDTSATLNIASNGNLELLDGKLNSVWSTNVVVPSNGSSVALLLDNGNLVLRDGISGEKLWESLKHPGNTFLPGSVLGFNVKTGENFGLTSWRSDSDPSLGNYSYKVVQQAPPQTFILINGSTPYWRSGPWDKSKFVGSPDMDSSYKSDCHLVEDLDMGTTYLHFVDRYNGSAVLKIFLSSHGVLTSVVKQSGSNVWETTWQIPENGCGVYGVCGPFGVCKISESPICKCLKGFEPKSYEEWSQGNWAGGCVRRSKLLCHQNATSSLSQGGKTDVFVKMGMTKLPDFYEYLDVEGVDDCRLWCLNNCSCLAYAYANGIGCLIWSTKSPLLDIQEFSSGGQDFFLRLANAELDEGQISKKKLISLATISAGAILLCIIVLIYFWRRRANKNVNKSKVTTNHLISMVKPPDSPRNVLQFSTQLQEPQLPFFDFSSIFAATNHFSISNKLGEGGFGPVYKGKLQDGREIAVKRLSSSSGQGIEEFKNETILISKLQHRNLVRLMGCCIENEEKLLIYEFMPNKSLDTFIFDARKREQLQWGARFNIIHCVARGLVYLHRDSFLRIIHRDLKVSNILLDEDMNPKISDFGLARIFQGRLDEANTLRVVGTLGYMSPEYAMSGVFSEKSDVFSFGILILEIISGRRNTSFYYDEHHLSLVSYAWQLWSECRAMELVDEAILGDLCSSSEVMRCIHVGLLCVQDHAEDRPTMPEVVFMLSNETHCPNPKQPVLTVRSSQRQQMLSTCSVDEATISIVEGR
ncbi:uncharacterized protein LOC133793695 [Humulus lupulus]|uniref:uncharacterized protein LOC133793695 n=1 Tax=Humulus lupulus TaxID=3486 RepID=UPI002B4146B5|nr:uncharacterized protein LOC133793695 [Humulus lupulus]